MTKRPTTIEAIAIRAVARNTYGLSDLRAAIEAKYPGAILREGQRQFKAAEAARFTGNPPAWAIRMVRKHAPAHTTLKWRRSRTHTLSSGHCWYGRADLVVTAGSDATDQRVVMLHEIAHTLTRDGHGERFYARLYELAKAEGMVRAVATRYTHGRGMRAAIRRAKAVTP